MTDLSTSAPLRRHVDVDRPREVSTVSRIARAPATWLTIVVGLSTLVRMVIGLGVPSPWILPDEVVYSDLAKSIAAGERPAVRGVPVFGWGEVYPTLIAPAWAVFDDPLRAYHAALGINALVMSLAAVPAYFLARMFVTSKVSILVAALTVLVPSMTYTGVLMTENAFYPVFLLSVLLIARTLAAPSLGNQAFALLGLGLVAMTRIQGVALVGAYVAAIVVHTITAPRDTRASYLRAFVPTVALVALVSVVPFAASVARGDGPLGWLGSRSGTFDVFRPEEVPKWALLLTAGLVLYVAVAPAVATALVLGRGLTRTPSKEARLFAAIALPTIVAMILSVAVVSASLDVDGTENLNERYVFYVVPLFFIGLALWIREGLPRPRPWGWIALATGCVLPVLIPFDRLEYNAGFQSVALLPWQSVQASETLVTVAVAVFTVLCGALWLTVGRETTGRLWVLLASTLVVVGLAAHWSNATSASERADGLPHGLGNWVDDAVPPGARVVGLWDTRLERATTPGDRYFRLMAAEILNRSIGDVYRIGGRSYYEAFLPTVPARAGVDRVLRDASGRPLDVRYVLVPCRSLVDGRVITRTAGSTLVLMEVQPPVRLASPGCARRADA